jgi:hypothetical protein
MGKQHHTHTRFFFLILPIYDCRLSLGSIEDHTQHHSRDTKAVEFVVTWHRASRMLFSEESLSLRTVKRLLEQYSKQAERSSAAFIAGLAGVLLPKMPFLGEFCCKKFAQHLWEIFEAGEHCKAVLPNQESPLKYEKNI